MDPRGQLMGGDGHLLEHKLNLSFSLSPSFSHAYPSGPDLVTSSGERVLVTKSGWPLNRGQIPLIYIYIGEIYPVTKSDATKSGATKSGSDCKRHKIDEIEIRQMYIGEIYPVTKSDATKSGATKSGSDCRSMLTFEFELPCLICEFEFNLRSTVMIENVSDQNILQGQLLELDAPNASLSSGDLSEFYEAFEMLDEAERSHPDLVVPRFSDRIIFPRYRNSI
eukprot:sb/3469720/